MNKPNNVPPDRPLLRARQSLADRRAAAQGVNLGQLRAQAVIDTAALTPASEAHTSTPAPGANTWVQLGPVAIPGGQSVGNQALVRVTGRITVIQIHPDDSNTIYIGSARGGVWKSTDSGSTWRPKSDRENSLAIGALAMAPSDSKTLYAGTGEGNVNYLNLADPLNSVRDSYFGGGCLVSRDSGETWTLTGQQQFTDAAFYRIAVHPAAPATAWAATTAGLFRTTDAGTHWTRIDHGRPQISSTVIAATDVAIDPLTPATVYVAFYGDFVYRSTDAGDSVPIWTRLPFDSILGGTPNRIALAVALSSPNIVYALAGISIKINPADGLNWPPISTAALFAISDPAATGFTTVQNLNLGSAGFDTYCLSVDVDPTTPATVYLSGFSIFKAIVNLPSGSLTDIGQAIHADHHALAFDPEDPKTIYAGTDGGIYKSTDGGQTWIDWLNAGLCITQFESIDQHPFSDALILGGSQDNGTEQFRNSSVFYHSADGDGGCVAIDPQNPRNMMHEFYAASPARSEFAGAFDSWNDLSNGLPADDFLVHTELMIARLVSSPSVNAARLPVIQV